MLWDWQAGWNSAYSDVQVQFVEPGEEVTLFRSMLRLRPKWPRQELADPASGSRRHHQQRRHYGHAAGVRCGVPNGLCVKLSNGKLGQYLSHVQFEMRPVNASGLPTGSWTLATEQVFARSSDKPFPRSLSVDVSPGRYEIRGRRVVAPNGMTGAVDTVNWTARAPI